MYYSKQRNYRKESDLIYKLSIFLGIAILVVAWPLAFILPVSVSFENGPIENLQVIVLLLGGIYNVILTKRSVDRQIESFHIWCAALLAFMAVRELSWGRVFYPIAMEKTGPVFVDMSDYLWQIEAYIFIVLYISILLIYILRNLPIVRMLRCRLPLLIIVTMIIAVAFSYVGDHGMLVGKLKGQIAEEFGELAFYTLIPALCIHYHRELSR